jgi:hypothetical protein
MTLLIIYYLQLRINYSQLGPNKFLSYHVLEHAQPTFLNTSKRLAINIKQFMITHNINIVLRFLVVTRISY